MLGEKNEEEHRDVGGGGWIDDGQRLRDDGGARDSAGDCGNSSVRRHTAYGSNHSRHRPRSELAGNWAQDIHHALDVSRE